MIQHEQHISSLIDPLIQWYKINRRILPWREDSTPYHIWVSEIMLQQTRVEAVIPYYHRFITALPTIRHLATADEEVLHKLWEGLGYYARVRNLKAGAIQVMENHGGILPHDYNQLLQIKGIGSYTAGAIGSIAFDLPVPAIDGNALRVFGRILALEEDIKSPKTKKWMEEQLGSCLPTTGSGLFNQAIMDIGSGYCIPKGEPRCEACPLSPYCTAFAEGNPTAYPIKSPPKKRKVEEKTVLLICDETGVFIEKRPAKGLLGGLWQFPLLEGYLSLEEVKRYLTEKGYTYDTITPLPDARHIFTHKEWWMKGYYIQCSTLAEKVTFKELREDYSVPSAFASFRKAIDL